MIRHFATEGNLSKRYIGVTDEPLSEFGKHKLKETDYPVVEAVFSSPLKRCVDTARLIYPNLVPMVLNNLAECDFGDFENKNYMELKNNIDYQAWIDSGGTLPFPKGEKLEAFKSRCIEGFHSAVKLSLQEGYLRIAMVVHGGTMMSILEKYSKPQKGYYHWQVENGNGYRMELDDDGRLINLCDIL
ncbi:MAG: alpha-ribazole phosphatase [Herbinix sp.]|jgi:alpha-ribazole phosphatase|nr:alpha-ribazole phosphatase [Herbinix sp.]